MFVSHPAYLRDKARALRVERGMTIDELAERLALPRTTIYYWVRDLPIPTTTRQSEAQRRGTEASRLKHARIRDDAYDRGVTEFDDLASEPTFRDFVCLYIAEGTKRDRNKVAITNSDPAVISMADRWLRRLADRPLLTYWVQYHADQDLAELKRFWSHRVGVAPEAIRFQRKSNSNQLTGRSWRSEHGVLTIAVCETVLRARLQAWIDLIRGSWQ